MSHQPSAISHQLLITTGSESGRVIPLTGTMTIGRDVAADIPIADRKSSRQHARLAPVPGKQGWELTDLGSSNGTWQGDTRVTRLTLQVDSEFRIGSTTFRVQRQASAAVPDAPATVSGPRLEGLDATGSALFSSPSRRKEARIAGDGSTLIRANAFLVLLHRIVTRSNEATTRDELFEVLDDTAAEVLEGDRCAVFLPATDRTSGEAGWELWPAHGRRLTARFGAVPFARTLLAAVRSRREPLLSAGGGDLDPTASMIQAGVTSAMAAPVRVGDDLHAALYIDRIGGTAAFTRIELEFLAAVANQLAVQLSNLARVAALESAVERLEIVRPARLAPTPIIGNDPAIVALRTLITKAAASDLPVLLVGEPGTGKELAARHLHHASRRVDKPLQTVSCAVLGSNVEAALFGQRERPGALEIANLGTLLIDGIDALPEPLQMRLAAALDQGTTCRVGDTTSRPVDVRLIATTSHDPTVLEATLRGRFSAFTVAVPPLSARGPDIDLLTEAVLGELATRQDHPPKHVSAEARTALLRHRWPGNVQELKDALERACSLAAEQVIKPEHLPENLIRNPASASDQGSDAHDPTVGGPIRPLADVERQYILRVLAHCGGNKKACAILLDIDRSTLYAKLKLYGVG